MSCSGVAVMLARARKRLGDTCIAFLPCRRRACPCRSDTRRRRDSYASGAAGAAGFIGAGAGWRWANAAPGSCAPSASMAGRAKRIRLVMTLLSSVTDFPSRGFRMRRGVFKRGGAWARRRRISGEGVGRPFERAVYTGGGVCGDVGNGPGAVGIKLREGSRRTRQSTRPPSRMRRRCICRCRRAVAAVGWICRRRGRVMVLAVGGATGRCAA